MVADLWFKPMDRHSAALVATGGLSSSLFWLVRDFLLAREIPIDFPSASCPVVEPSFPSVEEVPLNFWTGLIIGLVCWPLLEFLVLLKQWLILVLRSRIAGVGGEARLYKVL